MTTPTLPIPVTCGVTFGSSQSRKARVLKTTFGNNYTQRMGDGLNAVTGLMPIRFENLLRSEANTLQDFFVSQAGYQSFYYTPPGELTPRLWTCEDWNRVYTDALIDSLEATFQEVFTP